MAKSEYHQQYYIDNNLDALIEKTNRRMETLQLMKEIREINNKLRVLRACIAMGPTQEPEKND
jgi:hypothetical protein